MKLIITGVTLAFILAKVFGVAPVAAWPWWLVLAPSLIYAAAILVVLLVAIVAKVLGDLL